MAFFVVGIYGLLGMGAVVLSVLTARAAGNSTLGLGWASLAVVLLCTVTPLLVTATLELARNRRWQRAASNDGAG